MAATTDFKDVLFDAIEKVIEADTEQLMAALKELSEEIDALDDGHECDQQCDCDAYKQQRLRLVLTGATINEALERRTSPKFPPHMLAAMIAIALDEL
ncbi:hypothetical protein FWG95_01135 [Candidatus Saccharibacteria bacterium]|nr:hypothetical protein [Candidatus Saccharibacteria bacterium]